MPAAVNLFPAAGTLGCPPRLNVSKKQKKPRNPPASPFSSPLTSPFTTQYWHHRTSLDPPLGSPPCRICHRGGHPRRICAIAAGWGHLVVDPCRRRVDPRRRESTRPPGSAAVWSLRATQLLAYEREMREVLRGERGRERYRARWRSPRQIRSRSWTCVVARATERWWRA